ncbi:VOC family protein [Pseudomonas sp. S2_D10]
MFSHIQIGARDLPKMVAFYDAVLGCLGLERIEGEHDSGPPGEGWQRPGKHWPQVFVQLPFNGLPATWGNGMQVSFAADSPQTVRAAWEQAIAMGGSDEGPPTMDCCRLLDQPLAFRLRSIRAIPSSSSVRGQPKFKRTN